MSFDPDAAVVVSALDQVDATLRDIVDIDLQGSMDLLDRLDEAGPGRPFEPLDEREALFVVGLARHALMKSHLAYAESLDDGKEGAA